LCRPIASLLQELLQHKAAASSTLTSTSGTVPTSPVGQTPTSSFVNYTAGLPHSHSWAINPNIEPCQCTFIANLSFAYQQRGCYPDCHPNKFEVVNQVVQQVSISKLSQASSVPSAQLNH
jgi:hypothetical protein